MNRALASIGIAAAVICGTAGPALAADNPIDAKITYISSGSSQVSSPVTVKGSWFTKKLERTIEVKVNGGTDGDGTTPAPTPSPSVTTPAPNPTTTTPVPVPSVTTPAPTPSPQSGTPSPSAKPSPSETPIPSTRPSTKAESPKPSETKLAKTGTYADVLVVLVPLIAAVGTIAYLASRKEDN